ncbi:MAG: holocytochrome c synthase [Trizodia sp. TS-e1964]|nr:MAG: holocytochrome c synthase [Trizodia sp. TS-e1964]
MGWFWADTISETPLRSHSLVLPAHAENSALSSSNINPQSGCPMHKPSNADTSALPSLNPLNNIPTDLLQSRAECQSLDLPKERVSSTIPKGPKVAEGVWEYPSPQQMYNAMVRKGGLVQEDAVEAMVEWHNSLNEGAWAEILGWERRFSQGLTGGLLGSGHRDEILPPDSGNKDYQNPRLLRFMGRPKDMTPKATMIQIMGWLYPSKFGIEPPFDRHDWYVQRPNAGRGFREVRYVIDFYSGPPDSNGEPLFYLDVRPAIDSPTAALERIIRWGDDISGIPQEFTSTFVLTSRQRRFVDLRILKPELELPNDGYTTGLLDLDRLDWAVAGASATTEGHLDDGKWIPTHTVWSHWIDSKTDEPVQDEGDIVPQANGSVIETGLMVNPCTGNIERYQESWVDTVPQAMPYEPYRVCIVLKTEDSTKAVRGMVIRAGHMCQGLLKINGGVNIERWTWVASKTGTSPNWLNFEPADGLPVTSRAVDMFEEAPVTKAPLQATPPTENSPSFATLNSADSPLSKLLSSKEAEWNEVGLGAFASGEGNPRKAIEKRPHANSYNSKNSATINLTESMTEIFKTKLGDSTSAFLMERPVSDEVSSGSWERVAKIGMRFIPCSLTFNLSPGFTPELEEGTVIKAGDFEWTVIERYLW